MRTQITALGLFTADMLRQKRYVRHFLVPELESLENAWKTPLEPSLRRKLLDYYGVFTTGVLAENFARIHGRRLTAEERAVSTALGAMTPLFDDLFDKGLLSDEEILRMMTDPEDFPADSLHLAAILHFHRKVMAGLENPALFREAAREVFSAQQRSRAQASEAISDDALWKVTYDKGAYSLLAYRSVLGTPVTDGERRALYRLGGLLQLCNDTFDIYKDRGEGIVTLPGRCRDFRVFKDQYLGEIRLWLAQCRALPLDPRRTERFLAFMLIVLCRGLVAVDQLIWLADRKGADFDLRTATRAELICDMARPGNFWKSIALAASLRKEIREARLRTPASASSKKP